MKKYRIIEIEHQNQVVSYIIQYKKSLFDGGGWEVIMPIVFITLHEAERVLANYVYCQLHKTVIRNYKYPVPKIIKDNFKKQYVAAIKKHINFIIKKLFYKLRTFIIERRKLTYYKWVNYKYKLKSIIRKKK